MHPDDNTHSLELFLHNLRSQLVPLWESYHVNMQKSPQRHPIPGDPSSFMCRHTSLALKMTLDKLGDETPISIVGGTMKDIHGEDQDHWWVETKQYIIDLTASQFGHSDILITSLNDDRYQKWPYRCKSTYVNGIKPAVKKWMDGIHIEAKPNWPEENLSNKIVAHKRHS